MDKDGMIHVSKCCNATVKKADKNQFKGEWEVDYICNTCGKLCHTVKRKSSNAG